MEKRHKDMLTLLTAAGLEPGKIYSHRGRICGEGMAPNGREQTFSLSNGSTSDVRGDLNESSRMKRFAKANPKVEPPKTALGLALTQAKVIESPRVRRRITIDLEPPPPPPQLELTAPPPAPVQPPPVPAPMTAPAKTINKISQISFFKLCTWLQTADLKEAHSYQWIADRASPVVGVTVSPSTVREAYTATGVELPERLRAPAVEPHVYVARELAAFMRKLGENPSEELMAIAGKLERV
ncbi:hypothetical protein LJR130_003834 [Variovorax sp. LjRoot130]|uniref:hypothetical protein n=1 Tax=Variovorax sp. LjRoot130 TaxID=3342261 RepID=UPI003ECC342C